jgi:hypothetical protein
MGKYDWQGLMTQWNKTLLDNGYGERLEPEAGNWFGKKGATEEQIVQLEKRLGKTLPPSYREFLSFSNGWKYPTAFIDELWSTDKVEWFSVRNQDWADIWSSWDYASDEEYFKYGDEQNEGILRTEYMQTALEISDVGDSAIYLLNPQIVTPDGEWEAWFVATWLPGANRYHSFWEMMQGEYKKLLYLLNHNKWKRDPE